MNLTEPDCIPYYNIELNSCWEEVKDQSDPESKLFVSLPKCEETSKVIVSHEKEKLDYLSRK
ncbi:MAG: hypothetical protein ACREAN_03830 [Nitrosopumilaceae archaeon]